MTKRLAETIARLAQRFSVSDVATLFHVGWDTVKQIHARGARGVARAARDERFVGVRQIAIDEFALHKGQTLRDARGRRRRPSASCGCARGRDGGRARRILRGLGPGGLCADRSGGPRSGDSVRDAVQRALSAGRDRLRSLSRAAALHGASARSVRDATKRIASRGRIGTSSARAGRAPPPASHGQRRALAAAPRPATISTPRAERVRLKELLAANRALFVVYVLKEDLAQLWRYRRARGGAPRVGGLVCARLRERHPAARALRPPTRAVSGVHPQPRALSAPHQSARGHQQQDQSDEADGVRVSRRRVLLPEDPRRVSRNSLKNPVLPRLRSGHRPALS